MTKFDIQMIQDGNSNILFYDDTNRTLDPTGIIPYSAMLGAGKEDDPYIYIALTPPNSTTATVVLIADTNAGVGNYVYVKGVNTEITHRFDFSGKQEDFLIDTFTIITNEISEGFATYSYIVGYNDGISISTYEQSNIKELCYKPSEIYRAQMFEMIARNYNLYDTFQQRTLTEVEIQMQGMRVYDTYFRAMRAALEVGDETNALRILAWLQNYRALNQLE